MIISVCVSTTTFMEHIWAKTQSEDIWRQRLRVDTKDTHGLAIPREFQGRKLLDARGPVPPRNSNSFARDMRLKYVEIGLLMFASC